MKGILFQTGFRPGSPDRGQSIVGGTTGFAISVQNRLVLIGFSLRFWLGVQIWKSGLRIPISDLQAQESKPRTASPGLQTQDSKPRNPNAEIQTQGSNSRNPSPGFQTQEIKPRNELYGIELDRDAWDNHLVRVTLG